MWVPPARGLSLLFNLTMRLLPTRLTSLFSSSPAYPLLRWLVSLLWSRLQGGMLVRVLSLPQAFPGSLPEALRGSCVAAAS